MALSQKHVGKILVPWFSSSEWRLVYDKIYGPQSSDETRQQALKIINIWKTRQPLLPSGVEGTYSILTAVLLNRSLYNDYNLRLLLSTAIMRFLNICAAYSKRQGTFYQTALKMKLPDWLISLRHDAAHGQNMPSLDILDQALVYCLDWLNTEYWKPYSSEIKDFIDSFETPNDKYEKLKSMLQPYFTMYCHLNLITHPFWNYKKIEDIIDPDTRKNLIDDIKALGVMEVVQESVKINVVTKYLWEKIQIILNASENVQDKNCILPELLVEEEVFFGLFDNRTEIFSESEKLPNSYLILWGKLLYMFHKLGMLNTLLEKLLNLLNADEELEDRKLMASLWILEIAKALSKCLLGQSIMKDIKKEKPGILNCKIISETLNEKDENLKEVLDLDYFSEIPDIISDCIKFKTFILDNPNEFTRIFLNELLNLNETLKQDANKSQILELVDSFIVDEEQSLKIPEEIHTVQDLIISSMETDEEQSASVEKILVTENILIDDMITEARWRKVTEIEFLKCPLGILPWQSTSFNPLLPIELRD